MIKIVLKFLKIMIQKDLQSDYYVLGLWFTIDTFLYEEGFWINYITCSTEQPTISTVIDFIGTFNFNLQSRFAEFKYDDTCIHFNDGNKKGMGIKAGNLLYQGEPVYLVSCVNLKFWSIEVMILFFYLICRYIFNTK